MKKLNSIQKFIFVINNLFALLFVASFVLPYIRPSSFPLLSIFSLSVPLLIFIHIGFVLYWWIAGLKRQFFLSFLCIAAAVLFSVFPYKFKEHKVIRGDSFTLMSYNVRQFNKYGWIEEEGVDREIIDLIRNQAPDILSLQECRPIEEISNMYPYRFERVKGRRNPHGLGIFSKYPIVHQGSLDFKETDNNAIFIDVLRNNDTLRIYNVHLESFGIKPDSVSISDMSEKQSKRLVQRLKKAFVKQEQQVDLFNEHRDQCNYKVLISGDFNNTFYSWAYHNLKGDLFDSFIESGKGFGKTYGFNGYPLRIDFILADNRLKVDEHVNLDVRLSDHEPVLARLSQ